MSSKIPMSNCLCTFRKSHGKQILIINKLLCNCNVKMSCRYVKQITLEISVNLHMLLMLCNYNQKKNLGPGINFSIQLVAHWLKKRKVFIGRGIIKISLFYVHCTSYHMHLCTICINVSRT